MISGVLLHAGLETSFGAGERDRLWLLRGDGEELDMLEPRSRVLPLLGSSGSSLCLLLIAGRLGTFLILVVALVTQMTLRQVERWNCTK
jgi:hypothetical protein